MKLILLVLMCALIPARGLAQTAPSNDEPRAVVDVGAGFGTTWDDEGLLGRGLGVSGGASMRIAPRLAFRAFVDRVAYYRDVDWLTFDGRVIFAGAEASLRWRPSGTSPYLTIGAGMLNDSGIWIRKTQTGPSQSRVDEQIDRTGTRAALTSSGGIEVRVSERASIRAGLRFYGLLDTGEDLFPHVMLQPTTALVLRF
jgi:opacity protein-like surface antigen